MGSIQIRKIIILPVFALLIFVITPHDAHADPLSVTEGYLSEPTIDIFYIDHLQAVGGVPPYHWQIISGSLSPRLTLDQHTGIISGILDPISSGGDNIIVRATDSVGDTATGTVHILFGGRLPFGTALAPPTPVCPFGYCPTPPPPPPHPSIGSISVSPVIVNGSGHTIVTVNVGGGVGDTSVKALVTAWYLPHVSLGSTDLSLVYGTTESGTWRGVLTFLPSDSDSGYTLSDGSRSSYLITILANNTSGGLTSTAVGYHGVLLDRTPPIVTSVPDRAPDIRGWYHAPVRFTFHGNDGTGAGLAYCDGSVIYSGPDRSSTIVGYCGDTAGNFGHADPINYDSTHPTITSTQVGEIFGLDQRVFPDATCNDATSGIWGCYYSVSTLDTSSYGGKSYEVTATDTAGNTASLTVHYSVATTTNLPSPTIAPPTGSSINAPIQIPSWIKNNAKWWASGQIGDLDFVKGLQYLVENRIIDVSAKIGTTQQATSNQPNQPQCKDGYTYNPKTNLCVQNQPTPPSCSAGTTYDPKTNLCVPNQLTCKDGYYYDAKTNTCQPPASALPTCQQGYYYDAKSNTCLPK